MVPIIYNEFRCEVGMHGFTKFLLSLSCHIQQQQWQKWLPVSAKNSSCKSRQAILLLALLLDHSILATQINQGA